MRKGTFFRFLCAVLAALMLAGCAVTEPPVTGPATDMPGTAGAGATGTGTQATEPSLPSVAPDEIDELLASMTLHEKICQLFFIRADALDAGQEHVTSFTSAASGTLEKFPVGGVIIMGENIKTPEQITALNAAISGALGIAPFISTDEEGGRVARLANNPAFGLKKYKSAADVGASGNEADALEMGRTIGGYLSLYGFNMDFAPDADVNTNPDNPVIGDRSFSPDAKVASRMAGAMADGLREHGVIPTFKHFPGHGDTAEDSHYGLAVSYKTHDEMLSCEWLPFMRAEDCIMTAHISVPKLTEDGDMTPASLSHTVITDILRGELGFSGVVITDALEMGAITKMYGSGDAAVRAILAGCDMLLSPADLAEALAAVEAAVRDGTITEPRLNESVRRILTLKAKYGII